jgi:hypothetical protein
VDEISEIVVALSDIANMIVKIRITGKVCLWSSQTAILQDCRLRPLHHGIESGMWQRLFVHVEVWNALR